MRVSTFTIDSLAWLRKQTATYSKLLTLLQRMLRRASRLRLSRGRRLEQYLSVSDRAWWERREERKKSSDRVCDLMEVAGGSALREDCRLVLGKFEHVGVEVADGFLIGKVTGMRWYDCGIYISPDTVM